MDTASAFVMGQMHKNRESMVFDWDKAAALIRAANAQQAEAGLSGDWEWTGGKILSGGKPVPAEETYAYLASTWAVPELLIDGCIVECFKMASAAPGWDAKTYWPESALVILGTQKSTAA